MTERDIQNLLPPNATVWEIRLLFVAVAFSGLDIPLRTLWDPDTCPVALLPYLAWAMSVDQWDENWPESQRRDTIRTSFYIHQHKGTIAAIERAAQNFGGEVTIVEWFQEDAIPGTFRLEIAVPDGGISKRDQIIVRRLIDQVRPLSRHITEFKFTEEAAADAWIGCVAWSGCETVIDAGT